MQSILRVACTALLVTYVGASHLTVPARAAEPAPDLIKQAAAANGGDVIIESALFDSLNSDLVNGFNGKFGKDGLHLKLLRYQTTKQVPLYEQELRAGKVSADLLFFAEEAQFRRLAREGKLTPYCSENFRDYRAGAIGEDCTSYTLTGSLQYIAYNSDLVKGRDVPTSWMDLVDPKWKGRVSIPDPKVGGGQYYFVFTIYKLFGPDWFRKARLNDDLLTQSHGVTENQVMSGERNLGVSFSMLTRVDGPFPGGKNAPVMEAFPKEGGAMLPSGVAITKGGPNPAGAKVFIDWSSSLDAQKLISHNGLFSLRKDFTNREGDDLSKIKYLVFDIDEMEKYRTQYTTESEQILTGP